MTDRLMSSRTALATFTLLGVGIAVLAVRDVRQQRRRFAPVKQYVLANVPQAAAVVTGKGKFVRDAGHLRTDKSAGNGQTVAAIAPATADGAFELSAPGAGSHATLRFLGLRASAPKLDDGAAVYRDVLPDVDLVAVDDHERLELAFVVDKLTTTPELAFEVTPPPGGSLRREAQTDALLVTDKEGRARFRVSAPLAIDAKGVKRLGSLEIHDGSVRLALRWDGLTAPIVVDPAVTIPFWSILADSKVPSARVYEANSLSREPHLAFDVARGKTILVRPVRSRQHEDTIFQFGDVMRAEHEGLVQLIAPTKRVGGSGLPASGDADAEWLRGYSLASETWEWNGASWALRDTAALPGMIDPALAFDAKRGRTVLFGGAHPGVHCYVNTADARTATAPYWCRNVDLQDVTYEFDGTTWLAKALAGSPPPRVRGAMAWDASREVTVLFGGRELITSGNDHRVNPYGAVFPENFTRELLNDTWIYDGITWKRVATATPPPALESAQLVYDAARKVTVLVGGRSGTQADGKTDALTIWEFDGTDWIERLRAADAKLPASLRTRRGAAAFWNAARGRMSIFGGTVDKLDSCSLSDAEIATRTTATVNDPVGREALAATGCLGGYVHDFWEWDGANLTQTAGVVFGGGVDGRWVFRQAIGGTAWRTTGTAPAPTTTLPNGGTPLLPWRYDQRADHFAPRTKLERAHVKTTTAASSPTTTVATGTASTAASPIFAARVRPDVAFDPASGALTVFTGDDGAVYRADGATWSGGVPQTAPFADGPNDFFAATWDSAAQRIVLFDPRTGITWTQGVTGWQAVATTGASPAKWTVSPSVRVKADLDLPRPVSYPDEGAALVTVMKQVPRMTFDRTRGVTVMLYAGATWELDGTTWTSHPLPAGWTSCTAAITTAFDGARGKTVAYGCSVPATTWEWNGTAWAGPFASPYQSLVWRDRGDLVATSFDYYMNWKATLQSGWTHPNAAFESTSLGGVSMIDADGTLRTWNGTAWTGGAKIAEGNTCVVSQTPGSTWDATRGLRYMYPWPVASGMPSTLIGLDFLPHCFFPPVIEDAAHKRILAFRDGPKGLVELPTDAPTAWRAAKLGISDVEPPWGGVYLTTVHPYPFELLSPEHGYFMTLSDPPSRIRQNGVTTGSFDERRVPNLWWPFRVLADPITKRVRLLTNRGVVWELGGESVSTLGGACESNVDCIDGTCTSEKVCCDTWNCGDSLCTTCKGSTPGKCEVLPAGAAEPKGRCGTGECAGVCAGSTACKFDALASCGAARSCNAGVLTPRGHCSSLGPSCVPPGATWECPVVGGAIDYAAVADNVPCSVSAKSCSGALSCADTTSCKTACVARYDCSSSFAKCDGSGAGCVTDGAKTLSDSRGVATVDLKLPPPYSNEELTGMLVDAGMVTDEAGRVLNRDNSFGGMIPAFDPKKKTPMLGLRKCLDQVAAGIVVNPSSSVDTVVASLRRCGGSTPWLGDDGGEDCCPEKCITQYFEARGSLTEAGALDGFGKNGCYPTDTFEDGSTTDGGLGDAP